MQIAEPLAVVRIGEVLVAPSVNGVVPGSIVGLASQEVGEECGDDGFIVGPPELHVVPIFLAGSVMEIAKIEQAAELLIPATFPHPVEHLAAEGYPAWFVAEPAFAEDEPCTFDSVTGIEGSSIDMVDDRSIFGDVFEDDLLFGIDEVAFDFFDAAIDPSVPEGIRSEIGAEFLGGDDRHDARSERDHRSFGGVFGEHRAGFEIALCEELEEGSSPGGPGLGTGGAGGGGEGDRGEALAIGVAAFPQWATLTSDLEEHAAILIEGMLFKEAEAMKTPFQPFGSWLTLVVEGEQHPAHPTLGPDGLIGIEEGTIVIEVMEVATAFGIDGAGEPEREGVLEEGMAVELVEVRWA